MKSIDINEYDPSMGVLISLESPDVFKSRKGSINLSYSKILDNPSKYLDKSRTYYIYCTHGTKSRRLTEILTIYGYKAVKVNI